jgi:hypothetical protein
MQKAHHAHHAHHFASHRAPRESASEPIAKAPGAIRFELEARETGWEIAPGRTVAGYGYNGRVPGPVIEAKQGVPLEIRFTHDERAVPQEDRTDGKHGRPDHDRPRRPFGEDCSEPTRINTGANPSSARRRRPSSCRTRARCSMRSTDSIEPPQAPAQSRECSFATLTKCCSRRRLVGERCEQGLLVSLGQLAQGCERGLREVPLHERALLVVTCALVIPIVEYFASTKALALQRATFAGSEW